MRIRVFYLAGLLLLAFLLTSCASTDKPSYSNPEPKQPFGDNITREMAVADPLLLALVLASQDSPAGADVSSVNDLRAIVLQQVGVAWAAQKKIPEARWAFLKSIDYARKTRKQSNGRLRGLAESCLESDCLDEALEASKYLRVEDRCKIVGEVACKMSEQGQTELANELIDDALSRLTDNLQAGGSTKNRAYLSLALGLHQLKRIPDSTRALEAGTRIDPSWQPIVQIRSQLDIGETYLAMNLKNKAAIHARKALSLSENAKDQNMIVLAADLLYRVGEEKAAQSVLSSNLFRGNPENLAQAFARVGLSKKTLALLNDSKGDEKAKGLYLSCDYFSTAEEKKEVLSLVDSLSSKQKNWQLLKSVGALCAKVNDEHFAKLYFERSLDAYCRDWPEIWADAHQRAFVTANYARDLAEAKLSDKQEHHPILQAAEESLTWPQHIRL